MRRLCLVALVACSTSQVPRVRFANAPPVVVVDDRRDVPVPPQRRVVLHYLEHYDGLFHRRISRALELPADGRAKGVNALDEVPDSTWFTNRIGVRDLTIDELVRGPSTIDSPEAHKPWTILSTKIGGASVGFVIRDARGIEFLLKPERIGYPELETATHVIVQRLLWAAGYNVPEDHIVFFKPSELVLDEHATIRDIFGHKRPLDADGLAGRLARCDLEDGQFRALASRFLDGKPLGGHPDEGVRADDPNDRIPHEHRRDLRGARALFSWLDHVDVKEDNTVDVWVEDPADPARHYVAHYLIDFGKSLGVMATMGRDRRRGHAYAIDIAAMARSLVTAGLAERDWERRAAPVIRGVGLLEARAYDPATWKPSTPSYLPFLLADRHDNFWGAKLVMRFTPAQLRAVIEIARFRDPRAADYVTATLIERQRATARYWFEQTSPLDRFAIAGDRLCFDDLTIAYGLAPVRDQTRYFVDRFDHAGASIASRFELAATADGHVCMPLRLAPADDGYTIVALTTARQDHSHRMFVHLARSRAGAPRIIGIWRQ